VSTDGSSTNPAAARSPDQTAAVTAVVDGDTIDVRLASGRLDTVRLIGINAPEAGECFSEQSTTALEELVGGKEIVLVKDVSERDQYGRLLRYVFLPDGEFVNEAMVAAGFALAGDYPPDVARRDELTGAQSRAEAAMLGMWGRDACGASSDASLVISRIEYDAPGDDNEALDEEWVEITNGGESDVSLAGWALKDESASNRFDFPTGFVLGPGARVRVVTGCGADSSVILHWCNARAVWNNDGDTVFLLDPNGNIHDSHAYG
jgi:micrococcal nuclease